MVFFFGIFLDLLKSSLVAMCEFRGILTTSTQVHVEDKVIKVEILNSIFKNCSSKQGPCCTAGKSFKGIYLQIAKCTVSER